MARRVAVTGSTGFLGSALVDALAAAGWRVTALVRGTSAADAVERVRARARVAVADVTDPSSLPPALDGADAVIHAAAVIGYRPRLHAEMERVNVGGTRAVLDAAAAAGVGRLVHVSSVAAVGVSDEPVLLDETTPWNAGRLRAPYFDTKHRAERLVLAAAGRGLDATIVNPAVVHGPSTVPSNSTELLRSIARGRVRLVPETGLNCVPLATVVAGTLAALERGRRGRRYVLAGENLTLAGLVERVGRLVGAPARGPRRIPTALRRPLRAVMGLLDPLVPRGARFTPDLCALFGRYMWFDAARAERELGVRAGPLDACLEATLARMRARGEL